MAGVLLDRVNEQPPILLGLSETEFFFVLGSAAVVSTVASCAVFAFIWSWMGGLALQPIATPLLTRAAGKRFAKRKIGKPENYYQILIKQQLDRLLDWMFDTHVVYAHGPWSVIRRNRFEGVQ